MDQLDYKTIIKNAIKKHADYPIEKMDEYDKQLVFDDERQHYYLMEIGWQNMERIHVCLLHLDIKNGKIWIQKDFTEDGIATDLMEAGISKQDIVLAFHAPYKRPYTEFAVA